MFLSFLSRRQIPLFHVCYSCIHTLREPSFCVLFGDKVSLNFSGCFWTFLYHRQVENLITRHLLSQHHSSQGYKPEPRNPKNQTLSKPRNLLQLYSVGCRKEGVGIHWTWAREETYWRSDGFVKVINTPIRTWEMGRHHLALLSHSSTALYEIGSQDGKNWWAIC